MPNSIKNLTTIPIMRPYNWSLPFEIMCDASDYAIGAVLGQKVINYLLLYTMQVNE